MVLGGRNSRPVPASPGAQSNGFGVTGGPNAKTDIQAARARELAEAEARLLQLMSQATINRVDDEGSRTPVNLHVDRDATSALSPATNTPVMFEDLVGKKRRGVITVQASGPATLVSTQAPSSFTPSPLPPLLASPSPLPSSIASPPPPQTPFTPLPPLPSAPPTSFPSFTSRLPAAKDATMSGIFEGLGFLPDAAMSGSVDNMFLREEGENWLSSLSRSVVNATPPPPCNQEICVKPAQSASNRSIRMLRSWVTELEQKEEFNQSTDICVSVDNFGPERIVQSDVVMENKQDTLYRSSPLPSPDHFGFDGLTGHTTSEVPVGPSPFHQFPLLIQLALAANGMYSLPNNASEGQTDLSPLQTFSAPREDQMFPISASKQTSKPSKANEREKLRAPALSARDLYALEHKAELMDPQHPNHQAVLLQWANMSDERRSRPNFKKDQCEPLRLWLIAKIPNVLKATPKEKQQLQESTGLSTPQIVRWIINNRTRGYEPQKEIMDQLAHERDREPDIMKRAFIEQKMYRILFLDKK